MKNKVFDITDTRCKHEVHIYSYVHLVGIFEELSTRMHGTENFKINRQLAAHGDYASIAN